MSDGRSEGVSYLIWINQLIDIKKGRGFSIILFIFFLLLWLYRDPPHRNNQVKHNPQYAPTRSSQVSDFAQQITIFDILFQGFITVSFGVSRLEYFSYAKLDVDSSASPVTSCRPSHRRNVCDAHKKQTVANTPTLILYRVVCWFRCSAWRPMVSVSGIKKEIQSKHSDKRHEKDDERQVVLISNQRHRWRINRYYVE